MIKIDGLTKEYDGERVVNGLSIHVEKGEIYGFLGPNGAGKSTTIRMMLGLLPPTNGQVRIFGRTLQEDYFGIKRNVGVVGEVQHLYDEMTGFEYLSFFADFFGVENKRVRIENLLKKVDLYRYHNLRLKEYSKGMQQKIGIIRALLHNPDLLILDEPVSSLDPYGIKQVRDMIREENEKGKTFFLSSHLLSEIERTCHRVGIINRGMLVAEDTIEGIKGKLSESYNLEVEVENCLPDTEGLLRELGFVDSVMIHGRIIRICTKDNGDYRVKISKFLAEHGYVVLGVNKKELSLEEAFITLTEKNVSLLTGKGGTI
ncbi:MAG TPA: ABC transporter ATP-binding protein [Bacillota bacterium]